MIGIAFKTVELVGSVVVFIYGMRVMSDGLQKLAGSRLQGVLNGMTRNRWFAVVTGFLVTGVIQSSSATTIMVVTFANAGLLTLAQAIGVIMGANIGTTVTGWIVSIVGFKLQISVFAFPVLALAFPMMLCRGRGKRDVAQTLIGFGLLFMGLKFLKDAVPDIHSNSGLLEFLSGCGSFPWFLHFVIFVGVGAVLTILMQSSSATMALTITLAYKGAIDFPSAAAMILGENIGTTIKANLVSIGARANARRAARVHTIFNLAGVLWMSVLFAPWLRPWMFAFLDAVVPGPLILPGDGLARTAYAATNIPMHLSMFHTLFNVCNTLVFIWFVPYLATLVTRLVPAGPEDGNHEYKLRYIAGAVPDAGRANLLSARKEMRSMAGICRDMLNDLTSHLNAVPGKATSAVADGLAAKEQFTDSMQEEITHFLAECAEDRLDGAAADEITVMICIVNVLEEFADYCYKLGLLVDRCYGRKSPPGAEATAAIQQYAKVICEFADGYLRRVGEDLSEQDYEEAKSRCAETDGIQAALVKQSRRRIQSDGSVKKELLVIDILRHFEQIASCTLELCKDMIVPD